MHRLILDLCPQHDLEWSHPKLNFDHAPVKYSEVTAHIYPCEDKTVQSTKNVLY